VTLIEPSRPKGPYRELVDWLLDQLDRLEAHDAQLAETKVEPLARVAAVVEAHRWLSTQLRDALEARGLSLAA
jgi:hypothetical protein